MRGMFIMLLAAITLGAGGVFAASITGSTSALGGTGEMTISAPTSSPVYVGWLVDDSNGEVTAAEVTWSPDVSSNYTLLVAVENSTGSLSITNSGTVATVDVVPISPPVSSQAANSSSVTISQD